MASSLTDTALVIGVSSGVQTTITKTGIITENGNEGGARLQAGEVYSSPNGSDYFQVDSANGRIELSYDGSPDITLKNRDHGIKWLISGPDGDENLSFIYYG